MAAGKETYSAEERTATYDYWNIAGRGPKACT